MSVYDGLMQRRIQSSICTVQTVDAVVHTMLADTTAAVLRLLLSSIFGITKEVEKFKGNSDQVCICLFSLAVSCQMGSWWFL